MQDVSSLQRYSCLSRRTRGTRISLNRLSHSLLRSVDHMLLFVLDWISRTLTGFQTPLSLCPSTLQPSSCPCEISHVPNLLLTNLLGSLDHYLSDDRVESIKRHNAKRCVLLFLSLPLFTLPISQSLPILLSLSPSLFKFAVSKATAIQSQRGDEMSTPLICLYYCPIVLFFIFLPHFTHAPYEIASKGLKIASKCLPVSLEVINGNQVLNQCH